MNSNPNLSGVIPLNKPAGITSFDVIRQIKRSIPIKKMGHGGTLDRLAAGVLPVLIGEATKCFDYIRQGKKIYEAKAQFGASTNTDDADGEIILESGLLPIEEDIRSVLPRFVGEIEQVPPTYSALKVGGKRSSDLARDEQEVELKPRKVIVHDISLNNYNSQSGILELTISCETGTYIRSIVRDLGKILDCGAHLIGLTRTLSGGFPLDRCIPVNEINFENWADYLVPLNEALYFYPAMELITDPDYIINGKPLKSALFADAPKTEGDYRVVYQNRLLALVRFEHQQFHYLRVFNE